MQKAIIGFVVAGVIIVSAVFGFLVFMKDESKVAEAVLEEKKGAMVKTVVEVKNVPVAKEDPTMKKELTVNTVVDTKKEVAPVAKNKWGSFIKIDPVHYASGNVVVQELSNSYKITFENNFASANGPDLYVYLSAPQTFRNIAVGGVDTAKTLNLGLLKNISGKQEYLVSKKDFENHDAAIVIWCKQFRVQFSRADLK
jgi:hypothetical protein